MAKAAGKTAGEKLATIDAMMEDDADQTKGVVSENGAGSQDPDEEFEPEAQVKPAKPQPAPGGPRRTAVAPAKPLPAPAKGSVKIVDAKPVNKTEAEEGEEQRRVAADRDGTDDNIIRAAGSLMAPEQRNVLAVRSILTVFQSGQKVALEGVRARVTSYSDEELQEIDRAGRTAEATGWRMTCAVRHEIVQRLKKTAEGAYLKRQASEAKKEEKTASGVIDDESVSRSLVARMKSVAEKMEISGRELYRSYQIEDTFFYQTHIDPEGNAITKGDIEAAITTLESRTFLTEALDCKNEEGTTNPGIALILMAENKRLNTRYSTADARRDVRALKDGTYGRVDEDKDKTEGDFIKSAQGENAEAVEETLSDRQATGTLALSGITLPNLSGDAIALVAAIIRIGRRLGKAGSGTAYVFKNDQGQWTASTDQPKADPAKNEPLALCLVIEPELCYFSADIAE